MPVPFLGRLNVTEYAALVGSFLLVGLEAFVRIFTLALPPWLLELCYRISRRLFNKLTSPAQKRAERRRRCKYPALAPRQREKERERWRDESLPQWDTDT
ncbi:hypothetical protein VTG60DRAFT_796 [Thermothelomyces hinnuleus]